jgi:hypothetical protein
VCHAVPTGRQPRDTRHIRRVGPAGHIFTAVNPSDLRFSTVERIVKAR